ncbi:MAG: dihydrolipoamide acetyltransferase [Candidatus Marinimicrobia bacterium]|nr:dihydrolipoamide acetyltransferase [Candidatus Neomarinimicrobiota bacterium]|tara:strand:- start:4442 stop:5647 length:1206 start_codon:yes stop_codon:yes gene_type:complete
MKFILPNIGEGIDTMSITEVLIKKEDKVTKDTPVLLVETDKASMEIPIDCDCVIKDILVKEGDLISPGQAIMIIDKNDEQKITYTAEDDNQNIARTTNENDINPKKENLSTESIHATPIVKKEAKKLGIDINEIKKDNNKNRISKNDLYKHIEKNNSNNENKKNISDNLSKWGLIEEIKLTANQIKTGERLYNSWDSIPHVTQFDESDVTNLYKLIKLLKKINKNELSKVSYIPFFIKAASYILEELKIFNSSLNTDQKSIIQKYYCNIGFAVNTKEGLVVPVIKNVDKKSIKKITIEFNQLINKARNKELTIEDMSGGCFTISSLGNIGGKFFTPIINPPEVAILGISEIAIKPILIKNKFIPRKILPLSLSYDHRVINGADAAKFTKMFSTLILSPEKL